MNVRDAIMAEARRPGPRAELPARQTDVEVPPGTANNVMVMSVRCIGPNFTLWGLVPANFAATGTTINIYAVAGKVRALAGPGASFVVPAVAGSYQLANLQFATAGADAIEVEVVGAPPIVPAIANPALVLCGVSWYFRGQTPKGGESVW